jgi:outer membrane receptor protein involved in Fe transport
MKRDLLALLGLGVLAAAPLLAQEAGQAGGAKKPDEGKKPDETIRRSEEVTVESASKVEAKLIDAPATMSVVGSQMLETSPAQTYADLLRSVPGMNVIQTSARDMNLTTRQATSTLNNSQLVLVDGRSIYLDFFGLVLWDFVPSATSGDIKQIEVVRGPASVVWGANAMTGVVNVITKSPRENEGFGLTLSAGLFNRDGGSREADGEGFQYNGSFSFANAVNDTWSYKLSAGYFNSDPYSRPVGTVPLGCHPLSPSPCRDANGQQIPGTIATGGASYPSEKDTTGNFINNGTSQPRFDLRVDQDMKDGGRVTYQGGYASTEGIIHTGIGPFDIQSGSHMTYGKVLYTKSSLRIGAFGNFVNADAPNLLQTDPDTLQHVVLKFKTETYDVEVGNSNVLGGKHILTYGGNYRRNNFDISLAPGSEDRNEYGAYLQEEFFVSKFRIAAGGRVDKLGNLDKAVFSPRVSLMFKPTSEQSIRLSYNRAFRAPSVINNYLDQRISNPQVTDLRPLAALLPPPLRPLVPSEPFFLTVHTGVTALPSEAHPGGIDELKEEHIDAFELAYTGTLGGKTTIGLAVYQNDTDDNINFTYLYPPDPNLPQPTYYDVQSPAQGIGAFTGQPITLSQTLMGILATIPPPFGPIQLPYHVATYLNLGPIRNRGFEASIEHRVNSQWSLSGNYSWQDVPKILDAASGQIAYPVKEVTVGPKSRFNVGVNYSGPRVLGNVNVNYSDKAFWNDVLSEPYWGYTDSYTMLNATIGVRFAAGKVTASLRGTNLLNQDILQHIYGDLLKRSVVAEVRIFAK